jgi:predicted aspartyl protease
MVVGRFDPAECVIWVRVIVSGPLAARNLRFILDTGTQATVLNTAAADDLGYSAKMGTARSRLLGVEGVQEGYRLKVGRLEALGLPLRTTRSSATTLTSGSVSTA